MQVLRSLLEDPSKTYCVLNRLGCRELAMLIESGESCLGCLPQLCLVKGLPYPVPFQHQLQGSGAQETSHLHGLKGIEARRDSKVWRAATGRRWHLGWSLKDELDFGLWRYTQGTVDRGAASLTPGVRRHGRGRGW